MELEGIGGQKTVEKARSTWCGSQRRLLPGESGRLQPVNARNVLKVLQTQFSPQGQSCSWAPESDLWAKTCQGLAFWRIGSCLIASDLGSWEAARFLQEPFALLNHKGGCFSPQTSAAGP